MIKLTHRATALCAFSFSLLFFASPIAGQAQSVDPKVALAAEELYARATAEMDAKSYPSACRKLEDVTRLVPEALGVKLTLGECYEGLGKLASAWSQYALVEVLAPRAGQGDRAQRAASRAAALKPRLATVSVDVPGKVRATPGLAITRDGVSVDEAQWGTPLPVDVGRHEVVATAPGQRPWKRQVEVATDGVKVSVLVERLEPLEPLKPTVFAKRAPPSRPAEAPVRPWQRPLGLSVAGLGAAGLGVGAVLGGLAIAKNNESNADDHCIAGIGADPCDKDGFELRAAAVDLGNASTSMMIFGGVVLTGGAVLFFTAPRSPPAHEGVGARPSQWSARVAVLPGFVQVGGSW
jgi:hypothetical protein